MIIPAYNAGSTVERAIRSVLCQSRADLEVIVVDDGSTDATPKIVREIAAQDNRVRLIQNPINLGVAASRNRALDAATGIWIALLDADDVWLPERLEQLLKRGAAYDIVSDDLLIVRSTEMHQPGLPRWRFLPFVGLKVMNGHQLAVEEFIKYDLAFLKPLTKRAFINENCLRYDEDQRVAEDFYFYLKCLVAGARWLLLQEAHYVYIRGSDSLSRDMAQMAEEHIRRSDKLLRTINPSQREIYRLLSLFNRQWRATAALEAVRKRLRERDLSGLGHLLVEQPSFVGLISWKVSRHLLYRRLLAPLTAARNKVNGERHPLSVH
ncbi:glycosyltransferase family 2 protein [Microvirga aerilata]|uniref:glycosyltransferase family 2 protein n=1 Tax=Microvirga aerilata TaxID=670292 RepID=UPI00360D7784